MIKIEIRFGDNLYMNTFDNLNANIIWQNKANFHRLDGPAFVYSDGTKEWYKEGLRHRDDDNPAIIYSNGTKAWYKEGLRHRDDGPAAVYPDGTQEWYKQGLFIKREPK